MKKRTPPKPLQPDKSQETNEDIESEKIPSLPEEPEEDNSPDVQRSFPVVGIGSSAGGLEALELFLRNVPPGNGMAFVIVQHMDPTHKGIMVELLQRATAMPVVQVRDQLKVEPNHVYVIPPNKDMSILHGVLHLLDPVAPRGLRLPIDFFFRALADDQQESSVGVILSGMGSDGTLGLRAMKEKNGVVFVQSPDSAKFDGMPRSAIDAGLADIVADAEELPGKISSYIHHKFGLNLTEFSLESKTQSALDKVFILLRTQTGHDFSMYKKNTIYRRVERRMGIHQINRIADYVRFLQENPQESDLLFKELLIGVTSFFRDPPAWQLLKSEIFPAMFNKHPAGGVLRAWVPGCATGEEAYSLGMIFLEALELAKPEARFSLQIFATDLDRDAIDKARVGVYPQNISADVSEERLKRFFIMEQQSKDGNISYRAGKEIREMVVFAPQNLVMDASFTRLDFLICRNLLIYLSAELQKKLLPLFHYSLNPGGILFLGISETTGSFSTLFTPLDNTLRIYQRLETSQHPELVEFPTTFFSAKPGETDTDITQPTIKKTVPNLQKLVDQLILQHFAPAAVLVNLIGDILYISGRTGKYLEPAAGKANWNIYAMAREGLRYELNNAFQKALHENKNVTVKNISVGTNGGSQMVEVTVQPIAKPEELRGTAIIVFKDLPVLPAVKSAGKTRRSSSSSALIAQLEQEIQRTNAELLTTREDMQTSQEELKSANEELQSANEELQSTNEELTTSKEEMQSLNEEMQTVNHELQSRVDELSLSNNDLNNLLNSVNIAILFLDNNLRVRRFTSQATQIFKLLPGDTGRLITDISSDLIYPGFPDDVRDVLRTLVFSEKDKSTQDDRWFSVRIMPYRTLDNRINGVVTTFTDITTAKKLEKMLQSRIKKTEGVEK